jgi:hypothetical protein
MAANSEIPAMSAVPQAGVLYFAVGDRFVREAEVSARSLKTQTPQIQAAIFCNHDVTDVFDYRFDVDVTGGLKQLKPFVMRHTPFEKTIFLDTDTFVADSIHEVYDVLDRFELAAAITPYWQVTLGGEITKQGVPVAFPKLNSGVIAYRKTRAVEQLLDEWHRMQVVSRGQDQKNFRRALYASDVRFCVLPPAYNFRLEWPGAVSGGIKIFHGRDPDLPKLCRWLNSTEKWRLIAPNKYERAAMFFAAPLGDRNVADDRPSESHEA